MPPGLPSNRQHIVKRQCPCTGFALVISIVLMAFVVLLLVSLTSIVQVETSMSIVNNRQQQARTNALLGLKIAIGELQKQTGPDARVTAKAAILDSDPGVEDIVDVAHPYWTGVWKTDPATGGKELLTWLVSGNERLSPDSGDFLRAETTQLDDTNSVVLVETGVASETVRAKRVESDNGHYAYWVSGEQSKAKINRVDDSVAAAAASDDFPRTLARQYQFPHLNLVSQPMLPDTVNRVQTLEQMPVALGLSAVASDDFKQYFHDVTTVSEGLLTDTAAGGLKVDLSALLATALPTAYDGQPIYVAPEDIRDDVWATQSPTWNYLKAYYDLREDVLDDGKLTPRPGNANAPGISPVIAMFSFGFSGGLYVDGASTDDNRIFYNLFPKLVLYNPYNVTLKGRDYALVLWGNQVATGELGGITGYFPVFKGQVHHNGTSSEKFYHTGQGFVHAPKGGGGDANSRTNKEEPGLPPSQHAAYPPHFIVQCPDIPPGQAVIMMPAVASANYDRFGDHANILTNNNNEFSFRWFTNTWLTQGSGSEGDSGGEDGDGGVNDFVIWKVHKASTTQKVYLDATLLDPDYLYTDALWSNPVNIENQRYLLRDRDSDFYDHVYQLTGRVPIRVSEYTGANDTDTSVYGALHVDAMEFATWSAYGFLAQSEGHGEMIRPYANFNLRAKDLDAANIANADGDFAHSFYEAYGVNPAQAPALDFFDDGTKVYVGGGFSALSGGVESFILYDVPADAEGLYSLGQLQHMKVSEHFDEPGYAIGNSWASPFIERNEVYREGAGDEHGLTGYLGNVDYSNVDISYLLNEALWDKYFFSTITNIGQEGDAAFHAPVNPAIRFFDLEGADDLTFADPADNAQYLYVNGAFNVNSTSVVAWEAVLSALNGIVLPQIGTTRLAYPFFPLPRPGLRLDKSLGGLPRADPGRNP